MLIDMEKVIEDTTIDIMQELTDYILSEVGTLSECEDQTLSNYMNDFLVQMGITQRAISNRYDVNREVINMLNSLDKLEILSNKLPKEKTIITRVKDLIYNTQRFSVLDRVMAEMDYYTNVLSNSSYETPVYVSNNEWGQLLALAAYLRNTSSIAFIDENDMTRRISVGSMYIDFMDLLRDIDATNTVKLLLQPKGSPMLFSSINQTNVHQVARKLDEVGLKDILTIYKVSNLNVESDVEPDNIVDVYSVFSEEEKKRLLLEINRKDLDGSFLGLRDLVALEFLGELYIGVPKDTIYNLTLKEINLSYTINISPNNSLGVNCKIPLRKLMPISGAYDILPLYAYQMHYKKLFPFLTKVEQSRLNPVNRNFRGIPKQLILEAGKYDTNGHTIVSSTQSLIEELGVGKDLYVKLLTNEETLIQGGGK